MSFNEAEISDQDGHPIALYLLEWGNTVWRYTSADRSIEYPEGSDIFYLPVAISDNGMVQGGSSANDFQVDCPTNLPIVTLFRGTPPSETIWLTVRRKHLGEDDAPIYWTGNIVNVKRLDLANAQIVGAPLTASFKRTGLRLCWTRECPHFLYDYNCTVDPEDHKVVSTVTGLTGITLDVASVGGHPDGWFRGGYISWEVNEDGTRERRMIEEHEGSTLMIFGLTDGLFIGAEIEMYPGCDRTTVGCEKFDNLSNYGGYDFMPGETPFGTQIF